MALDKRIFIIIRYSVLTKSQAVWAIGKGSSFEDYRARLFAPDRLALHEKLFNAVTLPALDDIAKNTSITMSVLLITSQELPEAHRAYLADVASLRPWLEVIAVSAEKKVNKVIEQQVAKRLLRHERDVCYATVRLDDDDALASDFGQKLECYVQPHFAGMCVTFAKGVLGVYDGQCYQQSYHFYKPNVALGLSMINTRERAANGQGPWTVYAAGNHRSVDERYPTIVDSSQIMFLRTEHEASDLIAMGRVRPKDRLIALSEDELTTLSERLPVISTH